VSPENKKVALVTGGSRGIGAGICKKLATPEGGGYHVIINYASGEARAREVADQIIAAGGSAEICGFDVSDSAQVAQRIEELVKRHAIEVLVNNAGVSADGLLMRLKDEDLDRVLSINLKGAIYCVREISRSMMKARSGSIINVASVIGEMGNAGQTVYTAAKAGLIGFTKTAAKELASRGIRVNAVTPGFIETDMTAGLTDAQKQSYGQSIPLGYFGSVDDVANAVSFLAGSGSRYITGHVLRVNGGLYI
jgi:3-oxoacyl-[acyl-carrier protein] reductase